MIFHFIAGQDGKFAVAICLEHDLVTQATNMDEIEEECLRLLQAHVAAHEELGLKPFTIGPPPDKAIAEFRALPEFREFTVTLP